MEVGLVQDYICNPELTPFMLCDPTIVSGYPLSFSNESNISLWSLRCHFDLHVLSQLADLSTIYKPTQLFASVRAQKEFLSALEEAATGGSMEPALRIAIAQLGFKLSKAFEVGPCR